MSTHHLRAANSAEQQCLCMCTRMMCDRTHVPPCRVGVPCTGGGGGGGGDAAGCVLDDV